MIIRCCEYKLGYEKVARYGYLLLHLWRKCSRAYTRLSLIREMAAIWHSAAKLTTLSINDLLYRPTLYTVVLQCIGLYLRELPTPSCRESRPMLQWYIAVK